MSKIQDALNKTKNDIAKKPKSVPDITQREKNIISGNSKSLVKAEASSLIALMKEETSVSDEELINKSLIFPDLSHSKITDCFRSLRTQLLKTSKDDNFVILVTSCTHGTDSSFISMNMGAAFSFDESKTSLVIDCDINSHHLEDMLSLDYEHGLVDFLEDERIGVNDILNDIGIRRLRVIPSGLKQSKEREYFVTDRMKELLDGLVDRYKDRYIVLNSPALSESEDANILVDLVDYVVVVVPYGKVADSDLENALRKIDKSKLLGVILNDVPDWS